MKGKPSTKMDSAMRKVGIDSFYTVSVIGKGSYAKVLLVRKKDNEQYYAMKVLKKQYVEKKKQHEHVKVERRVLIATSDSPFVVKLHFAFQNDKNLYFVLDYCYGGELFNLLQKRKRLSEEETRFYTAQLVLAIEHLHKHDIVYRDLKPENVLLCRDGYIKITDFGLSHISALNIEAKTFCGTPEYLAPEILERHGYGKPVDWWALGAIIYEMLVGIPPFYTQSKLDLFERIRNEEPSYPKFLSEGTKKLLRLLLHKNPAMRLGSAHGASEIKQHPWFSLIDWDEIAAKETKPFFVPQDDTSNGLSNFDQHFTDMSLYSPQLMFDQGPCKNFPDFTWAEDPTTSSFGKDQPKEQVHLGDKKAAKNTE